MSDEQADRHDKTEDASPRRLEQARQEGQIALGKDAPMVAALLGAGLAVAAIYIPLKHSLVVLMAECSGNLHQLDTISFSTLMQEPVILLFAVVIVSLVFSTGVSAAQTGMGFWPKLAMPDPKRLFSTEKLKRLFRTEFVVDLIFSIVKLVALSGTFWLALSDDYQELPYSLYRPGRNALDWLLNPLLKSGSAVLAVLSILAVLDYALQTVRFKDKQKMTKDELKREFKEEDGDPHFRMARKQKHREMVQSGVKDVPLADALVVNPTHIAIAIRYRRKHDASPRVIAKGKGNLADSMREMAREHGIPIYRDIPLARMLYKRVKVGKEVPQENFRAVATVLAFVYRVTGRVPGTGPEMPHELKETRRSQS
jgi:flagellar biosynthesis protein FlhB